MEYGRNGQFETSCSRPYMFYLLFYRADEIGKDLIRIALNYPGANIQPAVECLAHLSSYVCHHTTFVLFLARKCFEAIVSIASAVSCQLASNVTEKDQFSVNQAQV